MRCSENTTLAIMHTVWQRQHNSIVTALADWNRTLAGTMKSFYQESH